MLGETGRRRFDETDCRHPTRSETWTGRSNSSTCPSPMSTAPSSSTSRSSASTPTTIAPCTRGSVSCSSPRPGSACSIAIGEGLGSAVEPGTLDVIQVVIPDADAVLAELRAKGVEAEGVDEQEWGRLRHPEGPRRQPLDPAGAPRLLGRRRRLTRPLFVERALRARTGARVQLRREARASGDWAARAARWKDGAHGICTSPETPPPTNCSAPTRSPCSPACCSTSRSPMETAFAGPAQDPAAARRDRPRDHRRRRPRALRRVVQADPGRAPVPGLDGGARAGARAGGRRRLGRRRGCDLEAGRSRRRRGAEAAQGPAGVRRAEGEDLPGTARQAVGVEAQGWREASGSYGEDGCHRSVADIVDPESLAKVRATKQAAKAAAKTAK